MKQELAILSLRAAKLEKGLEQGGEERGGGSGKVNAMCQLVSRLSH